MDSGKAPYLSCCKRRVAKTARVAGDQRLITTPNNFSRDWPKGKIYVRNPRGCRNLMGGKDIILRKGDFVAVAECKRYNAPKVTRPDVQKFHSALMDMKAKEGFFITTGNFTKPAVDYVFHVTLCKASI